MDWAGLNDAVLQAEAQEGGHGRRIVRVFHPAAETELWRGTFGDAPIEPGPAGWQFSDGETVTL